jgi:predicted PolB exonuclease-like 3'-5' exonuclease
MHSLAKEATNQAFVRQHLQKIIAISIVLRLNDSVNVWSLGSLQAHEPELVQRFFSGIEKYRPTLVSWNGCGFDLPVLHYRALVHGIQAPTYWDSGEIDSSFKYNNYLNRYHTRHIDLMDTLAAFQQKAFARLDEIAMLLHLPGKMGMTGGEVFGQYQKGNLKGIRDYCEIDVLNTYLIFLRFQYIKGVFTQEDYEREVALVRTFLEKSPLQHLQDFSAAWQDVVKSDHST